MMNSVHAYLGVGLRQLSREVRHLILPLLHLRNDIQRRHLV